MKKILRIILLLNTTFIHFDNNEVELAYVLNLQLLPGVLL